jgi:hypothetical protein
MRRSDDRHSLPARPGFLAAEGRLVVANHLIRFAREGAAGRQNASFYSAKVAQPLDVAANAR